MQVRDPTLWMWGEALAMIERADRLQRQFCQLGATRRSVPSWEPPADVFETEEQVFVVVALPGVPAAQIAIELDGPAVLVRGQRPLPLPGRHARIHQLEVPYGTFERRVELPIVALQLREQAHADGCLTLVLDKQRGTP